MKALINYIHFKNLFSGLNEELLFDCFNISANFKSWLFCLVADIVGGFLLCCWSFFNTGFLLFEFCGAIFINPEGFLLFEFCEAIFVGPAPFVISLLLFLFFLCLFLTDIITLAGIEAIVSPCFDLSSEILVWWSHKPQQISYKM